MEEENLLEDEQAGFRPGRSTADQGLVLQHLAEKYSSASGGALYTAFIDFKSAFDLIPRDRLWQRLEDTNIDRRLLFLIRSLYDKTWVQVRCDRVGHLTRVIPTHIGVRQGCVLAPTLFNIYINSLVKGLSEINSHPPKLAHRSLSILLYADDAVLLSLTCIGLRRLLRALGIYCKTEKLVINYTKSKVLVFTRKRIKHHWQINGHLIEQVKTYKYLGVIFQSSGSWRSQISNAIANAQRSAKSLISFFYAKGGQYIPSALQVFSAKVLTQLLYGAQFCTYSNFTAMESTQTKFLRNILCLPSCVPNVLLRLETGQISVESRAWRYKLNFWLKMTFSPQGLAPLTLTDAFQSKWKRTVNEKLCTLGFSRSAILTLGLSKAKEDIYQRISDIELQDHIRAATPYPEFRDGGQAFLPATYLTSLTIPKYRKAFTQAKFNVLPSAFLEGKYNNIPYSKRLCPCKADMIETVDHVLLYCSFYCDFRHIFITPILQGIPGRSDVFYTDYLLADQNSQITSKVAKFCAAAIACRRGMVPLDCDNVLIS